MRSTAAASPRAEQGRLHARAIGLEPPAERAGDTDPRRDLRRLHPPGVVVAEAPRPVVGETLAQPGRLARRPRHDDRAALHEPGVDSLALQRLADHVDRAAAGDLHRDRPLAVALRRVALQRAVEMPVAPTPVAAGRAVAGDLALQHGHAQRRIGALEVVRAPEPGEPGADDGDIDVRGAGKRRPRRQVTGLLQPQAQPRVRWRAHPGILADAASAPAVHAREASGMKRRSFPVDPVRSISSTSVTLT